MALPAAVRAAAATARSSDCRNTCATAAARIASISTGEIGPLAISGDLPALASSSAAVRRCISPLALSSRWLSPLTSSSSSAANSARCHSD